MRQAFLLTCMLLVGCKESNPNQGNQHSGLSDSGDVIEEAKDPDQEKNQYFLIDKAIVAGGTVIVNLRNEGVHSVEKEPKTIGFRLDGAEGIDPSNQSAAIFIIWPDANGFVEEEGRREEIRNETEKMDQQHQSRMEDLYDNVVLLDLREASLNGASSIKRKNEKHDYFLSNQEAIKEFVQNELAKKDMADLPNYQEVDILLSTHGGSFKPGSHDTDQNYHFIGGTMEDGETHGGIYTKDLIGPILSYLNTKEKEDHNKPNIIVESCHSNAFKGDIPEDQYGCCITATDNDEFCSLPGLLTSYLNVKEFPSLADENSDGLVDANEFTAYSNSQYNNRLHEDMPGGKYVAAVFGSVVYSLAVLDGSDSDMSLLYNAVFNNSVNVFSEHNRPIMGDKKVIKAMNESHEKRQAEKNPPDYFPEDYDYDDRQYATGEEKYPTSVAAPKNTEPTDIYIYDECTLKRFYPNPIIKAEVYVNPEARESCEIKKVSGLSEVGAVHTTPLGVTCQMVFEGPYDMPFICDIIDTAP